jgi:hypothetical protein
MLIIHLSSRGTLFFLKKNVHIYQSTTSMCFSICQVARSFSRSVLHREAGPVRSFYNSLRAEDSVSGVFFSLGASSVGVFMGRS